MIEVIPGILEKDWSAIKEKIEIVRPFAKTIHIDLLDGTFTDNTSYMNPEPFRQYTKEIEFELHLMVDDPLQYVKPFAEVGFRRFLGHIEMMPNQTAFVAEVEQYGEVGLAIDAKTPLADIVVSLESLDSLLIMTVNAGFSGQRFLKRPLYKLGRVSSKEPFLLIAVDGGITTETLPKAYAAGARRFVATSAIFGQTDPEQAFNELAEIVAKTAAAPVLPE